MPKPKTLIFLHGFMGSGDDFAFVEPHFPSDLCLRPDLQQFSTDSFASFSTSFCEWAKQFPSPRVIIGYSLGGRLALHCSKQLPELWSQLILTSTHTGLREDQKKDRLINDQNWARRLGEGKWEDFLNAWNSQAIFGGHTLPFIRECPDREKLSAMLINFSLAKQENFTHEIMHQKPPIALIAGELDVNYVELYSQFPKVWLASFSAHRVPWECSSEWIAKIKILIESLS